MEGEKKGLSLSGIFFIVVFGLILSVLVSGKIASLYLENIQVIIAICSIVCVAISLILYLIFRGMLRTSISSFFSGINEMSLGNFTDPFNGPMAIREFRVLEKRLDSQLGIYLKDIVTNVKEMKCSSKKINSQVSEALDISLVAGVQIGGNVHSIELETEELYDQIASASSAVEQIVVNTRNFTKEVDKQNEAMEQTGKAVEGMTRSVSTVAEITRQKTESTRQLMDITAEGGRKVAATEKVIQDVTVGVNNITTMIKVINDIAARTNLLAMNAAIEAVHAGTAGKGFAVVAEEIRKLAENTSRNSKVITDSLSDIINKIHDAENASVVAGETFNQVKNEVSRFVDAFREIQDSTTELATGTEQILETVTALKEFSAEISSGSNEMRQGADDIDRVLRNVKGFSEKILLDIEEVSREASDIGGAQSDISQFAVESTRNAERLYHEFEHFGIQSEHSEKGFNIDFITLMHRNWLAQLRAYLDNKKDGLKVTAEDYMKCDLGKWIYGDGKTFTAVKGFSDLEREHQRFHEIAGEVYRAHTSGKSQKAEDEYQNLMEQYKTVISLLKTIQNNL